MRIILLGLIGAGKGTQAQMLARHMGVAHVASGDLFRQHQEQGTELGLLVKQYMEKGELVPDDVTIRMIIDRIEREDCRKGFILDGFPRTMEQATALDRALGDQGVDCVVNIRVSQEEMVRRLSGRLICRQCQTPYHQTNLRPKAEGRCDKCEGELYQRADDQPDVVQRRIQVQQELLATLLDLYAKQGKLVEVDGEQEVDKVSEKLRGAVAHHSPV